MVGSGKRAAKADSWAARTVTSSATMIRPQPTTSSEGCHRTWAPAAPAMPSDSTVVAVKKAIS
ncbi:Uncharacterised protein [Mycobacteroides abscessus subsp. abscessus]|nr:Uncharacterised protein [Mycobacteroides abscessus subsp. abscessus]SKU90911.1 Uncharacterised protein [Mycobacteroides abscessus subsp. abscessus]